MQSSIDTFEIAFNRFTTFLIGLVALSIGLIAILIPFNLLIIKLGYGGIWWLFEGIEYALYFGVFAGAPWVLQQGAHVQVDVVTANLPKNAAAKLDTVINLLGAAICILLAVYGSRSGIAEYIDQTLPDKDVQVANWIIVSFFALSFTMLATEFLLRLRKNRVFKLAAEDHVSEAGF